MSTIFGAAFSAALALDKASSTGSSSSYCSEKTP